MQQKIKIAISFHSQVAQHALQDFFSDCTFSEMISQPADLYFYDHVPAQLPPLDPQKQEQEICLFLPTHEAELHKDKGHRVFSLPIHFSCIADLLARYKKPLLYRFGPFTLFPRSRQISHPKIAEKRVLTEKEVDILIFFLNHPNQDISRDDLLKALWGYKEETITHTLETHIYNLRQLLESYQEGPLLATTGKGYRLVL